MLSRISALIGACVFSLSANAAVSDLVIKDWETVGDGLITYDPTSNLEWLDLTVTSPYSLTHALTELQDGGLYSGFRYATEAEVFDIYSQFEIDPNMGRSTIDPQFVQKLDNMMSFFGDTISPVYGNYYGLVGYYSPDFEQFQIAYSAATYAIPGDLQDAWTGILPMDVRTVEMYGSWLVRPSEVPVPAAAWLFGSALLGLIGIKRKH
jgi:hypothetical protein